MSRLLLSFPEILLADCYLSPQAIQLSLSRTLLTTGFIILKFIYFKFVALTYQVICGQSFFQDSLASVSNDHHVGTSEKPPGRKYLKANSIKIIVVCFSIKESKTKFQFKNILGNPRRVHVLDNVNDEPWR